MLRLASSRVLCLALFCLLQQNWKQWLWLLGSTIAARVLQRLPRAKEEVQPPLPEYRPREESWPITPSLAFLLEVLGLFLLVPALL